MKSFTSYWQNEYHHNEKPSNKTDTMLSFYESFQRRSLDSIKSCHLKPLRTLESNAYFVADHFNGVLVLYETQHQETGETILLESHFIRRHYILNNPQEPVDRLISLEVNIVNLISYNSNTVCKQLFHWTLQKVYTSINPT